MIGSFNPFQIVDRLRNKVNPFTEVTPAQRKKQLEEEKQVKEEIRQLAIICNDILGDQRYKAFADLFRDIERRVTELMVTLDESDRDKYYFKMRDYQKTLRIYRAILKVPNEFVSRGEEVERTIVK
jgi:nitrate reductase alpha subunit